MSAKGLNKNTHISGPEDAVAMTSKECQPKPEPNVEAPTSFWEAAAKEEPPAAKKIRCFKHDDSCCGSRWAVVFLPAVGAPRLEEPKLPLEKLLLLTESLSPPKMGLSQNTRSSRPNNKLDQIWVKTSKS